MSILTTIGGMPLFSTPQEALDWGAARKLQGFHTHIYNGQTGYMGGSTHEQATSSSQVLKQTAYGNNQNTNNSSTY